jgi:hypothetical protein
MAYPAEENASLGACLKVRSFAALSPGGGLHLRKKEPMSFTGQSLFYV